MKNLVSLIILMSCLPLFSEVYISSGSTNITVYDYCTITWHEADFEGAIDIELWDGSKGKYYSLTKSYDSKKTTFVWHISNPSWTGSMFRIRIREISTGKYKLTNSYFSIKSSNNGSLPNDLYIDDNLLFIYPNPSNKSIKISFMNYDEYDSNNIFAYLLILNSSGEILEKIKISNINSLSIGLDVELSKYSNGIYYAVLSFNENQYFKKFIISR